MKKIMYPSPRLKVERIISLSFSKYVWIIMEFAKIQNLFSLRNLRHSCLIHACDTMEKFYLDFTDCRTSLWTKTALSRADMQAKI